MCDTETNERKEKKIPIRSGKNRSDRIKTKQREFNLLKARMTQNGLIQIWFESGINISVLNY